jgi:hypothetical protein
MLILEFLVRLLGVKYISEQILTAAPSSRNYQFLGWSRNSLHSTRDSGKIDSLVRHLQETAWARHTPMWAERSISRLFFNIVPTDTDAFVPPVHELEEPLLVKVGVLGPYG